MIVARWFLLISGPRVRVPGGAPDIERQIVRFGVLFCYVTPKNRGLHGQCTVFARSAFSWESSAWAGIALKCVVNFASGQHRCFLLHQSVRNAPGKETLARAKTAPEQ